MWGEHLTIQLLWATTQLLVSLAYPLDEFCFKEMRTWSWSNITSHCICVWCESGELGGRRCSRFPCVTPVVESSSDKVDKHQQWSSSAKTANSINMLTVSAKKFTISKTLSLCTLWPPRNELRPLHLHPAVLTIKPQLGLKCDGPSPRRVCSQYQISVVSSCWHLTYLKQGNILFVTQFHTYSSEQDQLLKELKPHSPQVNKTST